MAYSFMKKRRRLSGKSVELPYLLAIQVNSYNKFLYKSQPDSEAQCGLESAFRSVFPIVGYSGSAALEFVDFRLSEPVFDVKECIMRVLPMPSSCKSSFDYSDKESSSKAVKI